jgi:hypothetical protein
MKKRISVPQRGPLVDERPTVVTRGFKVRATHYYGKSASDVVPNASWQRWYSPCVRSKMTRVMNEHLSPEPSDLTMFGLYAWIFLQYGLPFLLVMGAILYGMWKIFTDKQIS